MAMVVSCDTLVPWTTSLSLVLPSRALTYGSWGEHRQVSHAEMLGCTDHRLHCELIRNISAALGRPVLEQRGTEPLSIASRAYTQILTHSAQLLFSSQALRQQSPTFGPLLCLPCPSCSPPLPCPFPTPALLPPFPSPAQGPRARHQSQHQPISPSGAALPRPVPPALGTPAIPHRCAGAVHTSVSQQCAEVGTQVGGPHAALAILKGHGRWTDLNLG